MRQFLSLAVIAFLATGCQEDKNTTPTRDEHSSVTPTLSATPIASTTQAATPLPAGQPTTPPVAETTSYDVSGLGSCRPDAEISTTASRLVGMADRNGDGKISKEEATTLSNFLIGGFFFRADANGDGTITPEEGREARADFVRDHPAIAGFLARTGKAIGGTPFTSLAKILDVDYGKPLTTTEARDAARAGVDDLFKTVDKDHDGFLTQPEMRTAALEGVRAAGHASFAAADTDHNGGVDLNEFQAALQQPIKVAFTMADTNKDGKLTEAEASAAMMDLAAQIDTLTPSAAKK